MKTLPEWVAQWGLSLDPIRVMVRRNANLKALGQWYGATRLYTFDEAAVIKSAFEARQSAKGVAHAGR